ncbi:diacylglycerol kinase family protein [Acidocella sp.]|uniref:diacylglycerol/lipid kinase family protein n=2 Tax=Acidocella sp. TaxID=50710 RepID=UPI002612B92D|nr:diacylglycerol kinase family protein [Acidocella sp.]
MLVIFNPTAGRRRTAHLWRVLDLLLENGVAVEVAETTHAGHAVALARAAAMAGEPMVVAAGGDGTIAEVANGLIGGRTQLGVIPLGTANVLAREYRLPFGPRGIAHALAYQRTRPLWPGVAALDDGREHVFVQMLGLGFDGAVVRGLKRGLKRVIGRGAYVWQSLWESVAYGFAPMTVEIDGQTHEAASVVVSKGRLYGGPFLLAPQARPGEPGFWVALFERPGTLPALAAGAALPLGLLPSLPGVRLLPAREVRFGAGFIPPAQADGDALRPGVRAVRNAARPISLIVSEAGPP